MNIIEVCVWNRIINHPIGILQKDFDVQAGDVLVDVGTAEGIFSIDKMDKIKKLYVIETDAEWIEALKCTFSNYIDKVIIIEKFWRIILDIILLCWMM